LTFEIWIEFSNPKIEQHPRIIKIILYENYPIIQNNWILIITKV
jgi:hypothetical protein